MLNFQEIFHALRFQWNSESKPITNSWREFSRGRVEALAVKIGRRPESKNGRADDSWNKSVDIRGELRDGRPRQRRKKISSANWSETACTPSTSFTF